MEDKIENKVDNNLNTAEIISEEKSIRKDVKDMTDRKKKKPTYRKIKRSKKSTTLTRRKRKPK